MIERAALAMVLLLGSAGCEAQPPPDEAFSIAGHRYSQATLTQYGLPKALNEISGLALDGKGRLFAHNDERSRIYRIDMSAGRIVQRLQLEGEPRDDFEGIAATADHLYLVSSTGTLYETGDRAALESAIASETLDAELPYVRYPAALPCEVEGLARAAADDRLIVACKNLHAAPDDVAIELHVWSITEKAYLPDEKLRISWQALDDLPGRPKRLQPSGIELTAGGNYLLLAGRQRLLLEFSPTGEFIDAARMPGSGRHPQAEGIAMTAAGLLLIADEAAKGSGQKNNGGRLSVYQPES